MLDKKVFGIPVILYLLALVFALMNFLIVGWPVIIGMMAMNQKMDRVLYAPVPSQVIVVTPTASPSATLVPTRVPTVYRYYVRPTVAVTKGK